MSITSTGASDFERGRSGRRIVAYTAEEVARMLRVSKNAVYDMVARGEIPAVKAGRLVRIPAGPFHEKFGKPIPDDAEA